MSRKNVILIVVVVTLLISCYLCYKGFAFFYYNVNAITTHDYETFVNQFAIKDKLIINKKTIPSSNYLEFQEIKIKNDFQSFRLLDESTGDSQKYVLDRNNNETKVSFWLGKSDTYVYLLKTDKTLFGTQDNRITNTNLTRILEKNNISTDIELINYLAREKNVKSNIFTTIKKMKENYAIRFMASVIFPQMDNITLIDGDYKGYIFNMNNMKEVSIIKNNKRYVFVFMNTDYFTDHYIKNLLETVVI